MIDKFVTFKVKYNSLQIFSKSCFGNETNWKSEEIIAGKFVQILFSKQQMAEKRPNGCGAIARNRNPLMICAKKNSSNNNNIKGMIITKLKKHNLLFISFLTFTPEDNLFGKL